MNLKLPKIAVIERNLSSGRCVESAKHIEESAKRVLPCEVSQFSGLGNFLENKPENFQAIILNTRLLENDSSGLESLVNVTQKTQSVIAIENSPQSHALNPLVQKGVRVSFVDKPVEEQPTLFSDGEPCKNFYEALSANVSKSLEDLKSEGAFRINFPVGVIGGGNVAIPLIKALAKKGIETHCYSPFLSTEVKIDGRPAQKKYEQLIQLGNLGDAENLKFHDYLTNLFNASPGAIVFATCKFQNIDDLPKCDDRRDMIPIFYERGVEKLDNFMREYIKHKSDATIFDISNPTEAFCARITEKYRINPYKVASSSPDVPRLRKNFKAMRDYLKEITLFYEHSWPSVVPELTKRWDGKYLGEDSKDLRVDKVVLEALDQALRSFGPRVMEAYRVLDGRYPYSDAGESLAEDFENIQKFRPTESLGYYYPKFKAYFLGPSPRIDYTNLSIHPPEREDFKKVLRKRAYSREFQEKARVQRKLAMQSA